MHREGFEPSHLTIVGLKSTALDHSAICAKILIPFNNQKGIKITKIIKNNQNYEILIDKYTNYFLLYGIFTL